jgi:hypothetical protein
MRRVGTLICAFAMTAMAGAAFAETKPREPRRVVSREEMEAIRWERAKQAAAERQLRIEAAKEAAAAKSATVARAKRD